MKVGTYIFLLMALGFVLRAGAQTTVVTGTVLSADTHEPIIGATVSVRGTGKATATNAQGAFTLTGVAPNAALMITSIGYEPQLMSLKGKTTITIALQQKAGELDETVVIAYGTTTRRLNTGSVGKVTAAEISRQPVANPLAALEGRVPGLVITQSSGVPGASFKVQLRGQSSLTQGSDPLFIIDGVPFASGNNNLNQLFSAAASNNQMGLSPFNSINPADIESIEVLKDADATAIYGSRGANGVILITTKKGKEGKTQVTANVYTGWSKVTRTMDLLNTAQYIELRKEAFSNAAMQPNIYSAPDLLVWDTTRYTDFKQLLIGGTARTTNAQASVSGGNHNTRFLIGGGYQHQTTVFPGDMHHNRGSFHFSLNHSSLNDKFTAQLTAGYSVDKNNLSVSDLTSSITLPPNMPALYKADKSLNWEEGGVLFDNPLAYLYQTYQAETDYLLGNLQLSYKIIKGLTFRTSLGYNTMETSETSSYPIAAQNPAYDPTGSSKWAANANKSWIMEPQMEYKGWLWKGKINGLIGTTGQQQVNSGSSVNAFGFTNDVLIQSVGSAASVTAANEYSQYRYAALFGRLNYNLDDTYILNLSARRDGSSRFGTGRQFANFGAIGAAWIFSDYRWMKKALPFLSWGKIRGSYGTTGNDQIQDYQYLDSWVATRFAYEGVPGLMPARLFNPDYSWEVNRKLEGAVDLGFFRNRLLLSAAYFRNRSSNQLIQYALPSQTGFSGIVQNFPALIENKGVELSLRAKPVATKNVHWTVTANLTLQRNKLISFPGLETSSYYTVYEEGQPLSVIRGYHFLGVDPATGLFQFDDVNHDGVMNAQDYNVLGNLDPRFYGGVSNNLHYKGWMLDVFFEFKKQLGQNYLAAIYGVAPGALMINEPAIIANRWRQPGDQTNIQKVTADFGSPVYAAASTFGSTKNSGWFSDASYIRLKNVALSYQLPVKWLKRYHIEQVRLYAQGQNIMTITHYKGFDPETQSISSLPPLKTVAIGLQLTL